MKSLAVSEEVEPGMHSHHPGVKWGFKNILATILRRLPSCNSSRGNCNIPGQLDFEKYTAGRLRYCLLKFQVSPTTANSSWIVKKHSLFFFSCGSLKEFPSAEAANFRQEFELSVGKIQLVGFQILKSRSYMVALLNRKPGEKCRLINHGISKQL